VGKKLCHPLEGTLTHQIAANHSIALIHILCVLVVVFYSGWLQGTFFSSLKFPFSWWLFHVAQYGNFFWSSHATAVNWPWSLVLYLPISILVSLCGRQSVDPVFGSYCLTCIYFPGLLVHHKVWVRKEALCPTSSVLQVIF